MESFIEEYISSVDVEKVSEEFLLERRVSPYATLRPGDLASLLKLHTSLPFPGTGSCKLGHDVGEEVYKTDQEAADPECTEDEEELRSVLCRGADQGHVPAVYTVQGLRQHEMPVVGVFVDERICPGFRYRVRRATSNKFFYDNEPRTLESIGMGYGKRLTFSGKTKNNNECFFWSDSEPSGFAFSIHALDEAQKFLVFDSEDTMVAEAVVTQVQEQQETAMTAGKDGVTKWVNVTVTCAMTYHHRQRHGLMDMMANEDTETVIGSAVLRKARRARKAELVAVENVFLQRVGNCKLIPDF